MRPPYPNPAPRRFQIANVFPASTTAASPGRRTSMTLKRMHWIVFQATLVLLFNLIVIPKSEALFLSIQNLGGDTITGATFTFSVEPWSECTPFTFQIVSSDSMIDPTNIYLQFDEAHPIGVGETYNSPFIQELTRATVRLTQWEWRGVTWSMGGAIRFWLMCSHRAWCGIMAS